MNIIRHFEFEHQYGDWLWVGNKKQIPDAKSFLMKQIKQFIPPQYRNEKYIKFIIKPDFPDGYTVGWKYTPLNYKPN
jgi:hypothetical protein